MKSLFSLLFALLVVAIIGGTAYFYWDISEGAHFERVQPAPKKETPPSQTSPRNLAPASGLQPSPSAF